MYYLIKYLIQVYSRMHGGEGYIVPIHKKGSVKNVENVEN